VWALVLSGASPGLGVLIDFIRWRTLEVVGAIVLTSITLSAILALVSGSTKAVLLEGAAGTAGFGLLCLVSLARHRPLLFYFIQAFYGGRHTDEGASMEEAYSSYDEGRHYFRLVTVVWGAAYLVQAVVLAVAVQVVATGTALAFNRILPWCVGVPLFVWTYRKGMRLRAETETGVAAEPVVR
jgi:hypothetical protein